jgi:hypothetical protein
MLPGNGGSPGNRSPQRATVFLRDYMCQRAADQAPLREPNALQSKLRRA